MRGPHKPPRYFGDDEMHRMMRQRIEAIIPRDGTWGFAIVRVSFEDDALFENAIRIIKRLVENENEMDKSDRAADQARALEGWQNEGHLPVPVDTEPNDEFLLRFHLDLLEDHSLQDASVEKVRLYFNE